MVNEIAQQLSKAAGELEGKKQAFEDAKDAATQASMAYQKAVDMVQALQRTLNDELAAMMPGAPSTSRVRTS